MTTTPTHVWLTDADGTVIRLWPKPVFLPSLHSAALPLEDDARIAAAERDGVRYVVRAEEDGVAVETYPLDGPAQERRTEAITRIKALAYAMIDDAVTTMDRADLLAESGAAGGSEDALDSERAMREVMRRMGAAVDMMMYCATDYADDVIGRRVDWQADDKYPEEDLLDGDLVVVDGVVLDEAETPPAA